MSKELCWFCGTEASTGGLFHKFNCPTLSRPQEAPPAACTACPKLIEALHAERAALLEERAEVRRLREALRVCQEAMMAVGRPQS